MSARRDALVGAARLIEQINDIAIANAPDGRTTVGQLQLFPNSRNVIPGQVHFTVDMRHPTPEALTEMAHSMHRTFEGTCKNSNLKGNLEEIWYSTPTAFEKAMEPE